LGGVLFPLSLLARCLEVAMLAKVRQEPGLLELLSETLERALKNSRHHER
jgi:hypothetical protein